MLSRKTTSQSPANSIGTRAALGDVPGPMAQAAVREYFERGSKEVADRNRWRLLCFSLVGAICCISLAMWQLIPLKTVDTVLVSKTSTGAVVAEMASSDWKPDRTMMAAFASQWVGSITEINIATWEKSVARATSQTVGVGRDQLRDFLGNPVNNPAILVKNSPTFVREYDPGTVNFVSDSVLLVRYRTTTRQRPGQEKKVLTYAMTLSLQRNKAVTVQDALFNPTGLVVSNFSVSEEAN